MNVIPVEKDSFGALPSIEKVQVLVSCFIISWFNNGIVAQVLGARAVILFGLFAVWIALAAFFERYFIWTFIKKARWLLCFSAIVFISSVALSNMWNSQTYNAIYLPMIYALGVFYQNDKYNVHKKFILKYFLIECIIISVRSMYILKVDPSYSRVLATGNDVADKYTMVIYFSTVYAFVALSVFLINLKNYYSKDYAFLIVVFLITAIIAIYMANFATAVFLGVAFIVLSLAAKGQRRFILSLAILLAAFFVFKPYVAKMFLWLSNQDISDHLKDRAYSVASLLSGTNADRVSLDSRISYIKSAWKVFRESPIMGVYGRTDKMIAYNGMLHDHNVWIDMLGNFGIVRSLPFILFIITWYKDTVKDKKQAYSYAVFCACMFFVVCGFFNPINKMGVQLAVFAIIPMADVFVSPQNVPKESWLKRHKHKIVLLQEERNKS